MARFFVYCHCGNEAIKHQKKSAQISVIRQNPRSINYAIASFVAMTSLNQSFFLILPPSKSNNQ
ncbi:hypothetical protein [uncultured Flavobacterium sp.]|uniref:hypothetical protein n=1 Tax=uncultured Flavobacterium sp. TaxID=165435 RepID=UPI002601234F|nr:hypothetical protein [uncultured Flavobacterium sp.]